MQYYSCKTLNTPRRKTSISKIVVATKQRTENKTTEYLPECVAIRSQPLSFQNIISMRWPRLSFHLLYLMGFEWDLHPGTEDLFPSGSP